MPRRSSHSSMAKRKHRKRYRGPDLTSHLGLEIGDRLNLDAGEFDERGLSVAELDGAPVTIAGAIPGEQVSARVVKLYRDRVATLADSVTMPSEHRVEPECRYFGECSGCQWQHIDYSKQLVIKRASVIQCSQFLRSTARHPSAGNSAFSETIRVPKPCAFHRRSRRREWRCRLHEC